MSFRTAYNSFKSGRGSSKPQGSFRDPTPEEWKKRMEEYYIQQQRKKNGSWLMTLFYDEFDDVYVWVETDDENIELSPRFDDEEGAIQWYGRVAKIMFEEFGVK